MMKNIIVILGVGFLNPVFAESAAYDGTTNVLTIPFVQVDNQNFSNVTFDCNPADNFSCTLLGAVASNCSSGTYEGDISSRAANTYFIRTRSADGIQFGGILLNNPDGQQFAVSWVKSSKDQNPYLIGEDLSQFTDNVAYGVVGGYFTPPNGFEIGDLVTVTGDSTGYSVQEVNGNATATFNNGTDISVNNSCNSLSGEYFGNLVALRSNIYSINIINNTDGSIQLADSDGRAFTASWDGTDKFLNKYSRASFVSSSRTFEGFNEEDAAFVTDIGNGIALTVVDTFTGKVNATAVFMKR